MNINQNSTFFFHYEQPSYRVHSLHHQHSRCSDASSFSFCLFIFVFYRIILICSIRLHWVEIKMREKKNLYKKYELNKVTLWLWCGCCAYGFRSLNFRMGMCFPSQWERRKWKKKKKVNAMKTKTTNSESLILWGLQCSYGKHYYYYLKIFVAAIKIKLMIIGQSRSRECSKRIETKNARIKKKEKKKNKRKNETSSIDVFRLSRSTPWAAQATQNRGNVVRTLCQHESMLMMMHEVERVMCVRNHVISTSNNAT